jgi:oligopeptide transport system ATP-binding protein
LADIILSVRHLKKDFSINKSFTVEAVNDVSFDLKRGEVFGLAGESGSGKSTLARTLMSMYQPTSGEIYYNGACISDKVVYQQQKKKIQKNMQIVFQDSAAALNPHMSVEEIIGEPLKIHELCSTQKEYQEKIKGVLKMVGLDNGFCDRYPDELSGGQRQRVNIARSLSLEPALIIADEPVASLDVSIQAQIINLFQKLQDEKKFTFLFIAHDLSLLRFISDRIAVMYRGRLVELAETDELFTQPLHPYTRSLLSAIPVPDPQMERMKNFIAFDEREISENACWQEVKKGHFVLR